MNIYEPVCDMKNQKTYQNPCLLGCKRILKGKYTDCLCLPKNSTVIVGKFKSKLVTKTFPLVVIIQVDVKNVNVQ